ncbi:MAG: M3 family oligoendopeptidase [Anaerolineales bacterium]|nr:M3 family oligoendopeptidase [Anaerolineales bacterium]
MTIDKPTRWSLDALFPSPDGPEIAKAFAELDRFVAKSEKDRARLTPRISAKAFRTMIREREEIRSLARRLMSYAELHFCENTQDQAAMTFLANTEQKMAEIENRLLFFSIWWKSLPSATARRLMADSGPYRYFLQQLRRMAPHTLSEPEEKIVNLKNATGASALTTLYEAMTNRLRFELDVAGEKKSLSSSEVTVYFRSPSPEMREAAYRSYYRVYSREGPILGQMYAALVRDWRNENLSLRKFRSPVSVRNLWNDLPDKVVRLLLDVCRANAPLFQRYFELKAGLLGMPRLRRFDIYAPLTASEKRYPFSRAWDLVRQSLAEFDPVIAGLAERVLTDRHLDSEVRPGKRDGAFCLSVIPSLTPWVLTNYQGRAYDLATLAHELGHAVHAMLAADLPLFTYDATLPLAETASTFAEMLLVDNLLKGESDDSVQRDLLFRQMDDAYATILRQAFFAMFEIEAHDAIAGGATAEDLCELYWRNLKTQFGDSVELAEEFRWEWAAIPHFFESPFYVYAYAFGQLLVLALFHQYQTEGPAFLPRYKRILSAGGSASPAAILKRAGIRIDQSDFWQGGFDLLGRRIADLE